MTTLDENALPEAPGCDGCTVLNARREFLRTSLASAVGALITLGASPSTAHALGVRFIAGMRRADDQMSYPLPTADGAFIDRDNAVILTRYHDVVYAFALSCPHQNTSLKWLASDSIFQCPKHKSKYRPDGAFIEGRATRGMDRYAIKRDGAKVVVDLTKLFEQDKDAAGWASAQLACA